MIDANRERIPDAATARGVSVIRPISGPCPSVAGLVAALVAEVPAEHGHRTGEKAKEAESPCSTYWSSMTMPPWRL